MVKGDLINEVAKVVGSKKEAQEAVHCVFLIDHQGIEKRRYGNPDWIWYFQSDPEKCQKGT